jgi:hypothetical protein
MWDVPKACLTHDDLRLEEIWAGGYSVSWLKPELEWPPAQLIHHQLKDLIHPARHRRVHQCLIQQAGCPYRNDHALKLATLASMDGDGVCKPRYFVFPSVLSLSMRGSSSDN